MNLSCKDCSKITDNYLAGCPLFYCATEEELWLYIKLMRNTIVFNICVLTPKIPFNPILFLSMDSLASGGIIHFPPGPWIAVTFLSSH